jgi:malonate transporter and related proteins
MDVLLRVIPFFLLIGIGAVAARTRVLDMVGARALSAYVFWIAFPALLIHSLSAMPRPDAALAAGLAAYGLGMVAPFFAILVIGRTLNWPREQRAGGGVASMAASSAFLGAPLAVSLFGPSAAGPAAAMVAFDCTVIMVIATWTLTDAADDAAWRGTALAAAGNPLLIAAMIGLGLCLTGYQAIGPLNEALGVLRQTASPVGLVALGAVVGLEFGRPDRKDVAPLFTALTFRLFLAPVLVWLATGLAGVDPIFRATATLIAAGPTAVSVFIQTRTLGVFSRGGGLAVVLAAIVAAVSLPLIGVALESVVSRPTAP